MLFSFGNFSFESGKEVINGGKDVIILFYFTISV